MISVALRRPETPEKRLDFERGKVLLGADPRCDIVVTDPGVDQEQALLVRRGDGVQVFDIGEQGGVLVNGKPVPHARLAPGDEVWLGRTVVHLLPPLEDGGVAFTEGTSTVRAEVPADGEPSPVVAAPVTGRGRTTPAQQQGPMSAFDLLNEVRRLINSIGSSENIFESILNTLFSAVAVRRGFIGLLDKQGELQVKAHRNREQARKGSGPIEVSRTLVGKVLQSGNAVLTSDAEADPDFSAARSIHRLRIKAAICVPLKVEGKVIGLLYGDNRERPGALTRDHLSILSALASVAAAAVEKYRLLDEYDAKLKIEQALSIASSIQRNMLPSRALASEWLEVHGASVPCDETGGDYFDYMELEGGRIGCVIADVTGHGVGPALLMATVRASLRALVSHEPSLEALAFRLNNLVCDDVRDGRFITLFMGVFDHDERVFLHMGAGHTPPILWRKKDQSTHLLLSKGPPLGIVRDLPFQEGSPAPMAAGDVLLFTTDGIIEADNGVGDQFGMARLREVVANNAGRAAHEIVAAVQTAVDEFTGHTPLRDDATLIAVKVKS